MSPAARVFRAPGLIACVVLALWLVALAAAQQTAPPGANWLEVKGACRESKLRQKQSVAQLSPLDTKCLTSKTDELCSGHMKSVKDTLVSALQNGCAGCGAAERAAASAAASALVSEHRHVWKLLVQRHARRNARPKHCTRHQSVSQNATKIEDKFKSVMGNATGERVAGNASNSSTAAPCSMCRGHTKSKSVKKFQPPARHLKKRFNNAKKDFAFWVY